MGKFYLIKKDNSLYFARSWRACDRIVKDCNRATFTVFNTMDEAHEFLMLEYRKRGIEMPNDPFNEGMPAL